MSLQLPLSRKPQLLISVMPAFCLLLQLSLHITLNIKGAFQTITGDELIKVGNGQPVLKRKTKVRVGVFGRLIIKSISSEIQERTQLEKVSVCKQCYILYISKT